jgi:phosphate transport system protein
MSTFAKKLAQLQDDLTIQGDRVVEHTLRAVRSYFKWDPGQASTVIEEDQIIDRTDIDIERASIPLLAMGETNEHGLRSVLTVVKVNNELERIADCAVTIAEVVVDNPDRDGETVPPTFEVMANSVIGMLRDANKALAVQDRELAEKVLAYDDTVARFSGEISLDAQEKVAAGTFSARFAFRLVAVIKALERIADHCTNICEQVIYLESGMIVRHLPEGWTKPTSVEEATRKRS